MSGQQAALADDEERKPGRPGAPFDLARLLRAVRGGWWLLLTGAILGLLGGLGYYTFVFEESFEATATIRYEGVGEQSSLEKEAELQALMLVTTKPEYLEPLRSELGMDGVPLPTIMAVVAPFVDIPTRVVEFTAYADDPVEAAAYANTAVEVFERYHRERMNLDVTAELESIRREIAAAERALASAQQAYDRFREANNITEVDEDTQAAINRAAETAAAVAETEAEIGGLERRLAQIAEELQRTPETLEREVGPGNSGRLRELRQRLAEARGQGYSDEHPAVRSLLSRIATLEQQSGEGRTQQVNNPRYAQLVEEQGEKQSLLETAQGRLVSQQRTAQEAQRRAESLSQATGQASTLLTRVRVQRDLIGSKRTRETALQNQMETLNTGFTVVSSARPPTSPVASKKKFLIPLAIPLFVFLVFLFVVLAREYRGLRLFTPAEIAWWGNGPVVGTTTWPRNPHALFDLVADLDDFLPTAHGTMLIVGATAKERVLADEVATELNRDLTRTTLAEVPVEGLGAPAALPASTTDSDGQSPHSDVIEGEVISRDDFDPLAGAPTKISFFPPNGEAQPALQEVERLVCSGWTGPTSGQGLRRAARLADRVLVVVSSGQAGAIELYRLKSRLGRKEGVGFILVNASEEVSKLPDRAGEVLDFWQATAK